MGTLSINHPQMSKITQWLKISKTNNSIPNNVFLHLYANLQLKIQNNNTLKSDFFKFQI